MSYPISKEELAAELKKCPFCGERPRVYSASGSPNYFMAQCYQCQIGTDYLPEAELVKLWNRRTSDKPRRRLDSFDWYLIAGGIILIGACVWFLWSINTAMRESRERMQEALKEYYGKR
jgi:hypothetical protein